MDRDDKAFWLEVRRGLLLVTRAIEWHYPDAPTFWAGVHHGLKTVVHAIETRWRLPRSGANGPYGQRLATIGQNSASLTHEPPQEAPARSSFERD